MSDTDQFSDTEILAKTLYGECRGEPFEGKQAVANVIMNRVNNPRWWGNDVRSVCLRAYQFSCWLQFDPNRSKIMEVTSDDPVYEQCIELAVEAMSGNLSDVTGGCDSYLRIGTVTDWSKKLTPYCEIGHHSFYVTV